MTCQAELSKVKHKKPILFNLFVVDGLIFFPSELFLIVGLISCKTVNNSMKFNYVFIKSP